MKSPGRAGSCVTENGCIVNICLAAFLQLDFSIFGHLAISSNKLDKLNTELFKLTKLYRYYTSIPWKSGHWLYLVLVWKLVTSHIFGSLQFFFQEVYKKGFVWWNILQNEHTFRKPVWPVPVYTSLTNVLTSEHIFDLFDRAVVIQQLYLKWPCWAK